MIRYNLKQLDDAGFGPIPWFLVAPLWEWLILHAEDEVLHVRFWFWTYTIRWRDLFPLLTRLLGKPNVPQP